MIPKAQRTVGIIQPNYLPWRGYFGFIAEVDFFVFLDDVQYTRRDWRNRNRIRLPSGQSKWITVPVHSAQLGTKINEIQIDNSKDWAANHLTQLRQNYRRTDGFDGFFPWLEAALSAPHDRLSALDISLTEGISRKLGIKTEFLIASDLDAPGSREDHLISLCEKVGATRYLSGPAALSYLEPQKWEDAGIELAIKDYSNYPPYPQIAEPFEPAMSIVDLIFMTGDNASSYIPALCK